MHSEVKYSHSILRVWLHKYVQYVHMDKWRKSRKNNYLAEKNMDFVLDDNK